MVSKAASNPVSNEYVKRFTPALNQYRHQCSPSGPTSKHLYPFFVNIRIEMKLDGGIWAWFISLLQPACCQQDSVVRIKGYTIWKRSIHRLSRSILLTPDYCQIWTSLAFLMKMAACLVYVNTFHAILKFIHFNHLLLLITVPLSLQGETHCHQGGSTCLSGLVKSLYFPGKYHCLVSGSTHNKKSQYQFWIRLRVKGCFIMRYSSSQTFCLLSVSIAKYHSTLIFEYLEYICFTIT